MAKSSETTPLGKGSARTVVSIPADIVERIDAKIAEQGGDALRALGVGPETLRTGFVHKLLNESLSNGGAA